MARQDSVRSWQRRPSPLARWGVWVYLAVVVALTLNPMSGWRDLGLSPFSFLSAGMPRWWTPFDLVSYVLAYIPLGALAAWALHPHIRGWLAAVLVTLAGSLVSLCLEATQTWLPTRIPSSLDWVANSGGALLGALIGVFTAARLIDRGWLAHLRLRWFEHDASAGLVLCGLWLLALTPPMPLMLGYGQILDPLLGMLGESVGLPFQVSYWISPAAVDSIGVEALCAAGGLAGAGALFLSLTRPHAPHTALAGAWISLAALIKLVASGVLLGWDRIGGLLTAGAQAGVVLGLLVLLPLATASQRTLRRLAAGGITLALVMANIAPENEYQMLFRTLWDGSRWLNFVGLSTLVAAIWPLAALLWLWLRPAPDTRPAARPSL